jgi:hypothetical protein
VEEPGGSVRESHLNLRGGQQLGIGKGVSDGGNGERRNAGILRLEKHGFGEGKISKGHGHGHFGKRGVGGGGEVLGSCDSHLINLRDGRGEEEEEEEEVSVCMHKPRGLPLLLLQASKTKHGEKKKKTLSFRFFSP